jgi:hypothetical protein
VSTRLPVDRQRILLFLTQVGDRFRRPGRVYLVGGTTMVLEGSRRQSLDMDLIVLFLIVALASSCAIPYTHLPSQRPQSIASPPPLTSTPMPTALTLSPKIGPSEKWIEVDLTAQQVRLRQGNQILAEYLASSGVATTPETTTYAGVNQVQQPAFIRCQWTKTEGCSTADWVSR